VTGPGAKERKYCPVCRGEPEKPAHRWSLGAHLQREHNLDLLANCVTCWESGVFYQSPKWSDLRRHVKTHHLQELDEEPGLGMWCVVPFCPRRYVNCTRQHMVPLPESASSEVDFAELMAWGRETTQPWEIPHARRKAGGEAVPAPTRPTRAAARLQTQKKTGDEVKKKTKGAGQKALGAVPLMPRALQDPDTPDVSVPSSPVQSSREGSPQPGPSGYQGSQGSPRSSLLEGRLDVRVAVDSPRGKSTSSKGGGSSPHPRKSRSPKRHQAPTSSFGAQASFMSSGEESQEEVVGEETSVPALQFDQPLEELAAGDPSVTREDWVAWERVSRRLEGSSPGGVTGALRHIRVTAGHPSAQRSKATQCQTQGRSVRVQASVETRNRGVMTGHVAQTQGESVGVNTDPPRPLVLDTLPDGDVRITIPGIPGMTAVLPPLRLDPSQPH